MITLQHIDKSFHRGTVNETSLFRDFSLKVEEGSFVSVVGSNGSGKTTMLNIISGTVPVDAGGVFLGDTDISRFPEHRRARRIGRVYQDPSLGTVPSMTITENMTIASNKGKPYSLTFAAGSAKMAEFREQVAQLGLGLEDKMHVPVGQLSGGQRQALSLLMSTMTPIDLLLLDEHTAALDPKTAELIMQLTDRIIKQRHLTALMVTHNLRYAVDYGDRLLMMHEGHAVLDVAGEEKKKTKVEDVLKLFNDISIECGN